MEDERPQETGPNYEVRVGGHLTRTLRAEFEQVGLVAKARPAETVLYGPVVDQAALYGLLRQFEALGLELVELRRVPAPREPTESRAGAAPGQSD